MSRGHGKIQQVLWGIMLHHSRPLTFEEILGKGERWHPNRERSARRALHSIVKDGTFVTIGKGGRADPFRYFFNPMMFDLIPDRKTAKALWREYARATRVQPPVQPPCNPV